jgi:hypothetical protein
MLALRAGMRVTTDLTDAGLNPFVEQQVHKPLKHREDWPMAQTKVRRVNLSARRSTYPG